MSYKCSSCGNTQDASAYCIRCNCPVLYGVEPKKVKLVYSALTNEWQVWEDGGIRPRLTAPGTIEGKKQLIEMVESVNLEWQES